MSADQQLFPLVTGAMYSASIAHARTGGMPNRVQQQIHEMLAVAADLCENKPSVGQALTP